MSTSNFKFLLFSVSLLSTSQVSATLNAIEYIERYRDIAIQEMKRTGIPASVKMAQAILESGFGSSELATNAHNHFGMKCPKGWVGRAYYKSSDFGRKNPYRVFNSVEDCFISHSCHLTAGNAYQRLFLISPLDYKAWAIGLKEAGYASDPNYAALLIKIIEGHKLSQLDSIGANNGSSAQSPLPPQLTINRNNDVINPPKVRLPNPTPSDIYTKTSTNPTPAAKPAFSKDPKSSYLPKLTPLRETDKPQSRKAHYNIPKEMGSLIDSPKHLPAAPPLIKQGKYIAKKGDTIFIIARKFGVSVADLKRINNMQDNNLTPGQVIYTQQPKGDGN